MTPQLDPPPPGTYCPDCGHEMAFTNPDFCGECEERRHDRIIHKAMHDLEAEQ